MTEVWSKDGEKKELW